MRVEILAGGAVGAAVAAAAAALVRRRYPGGAGPAGFEDRPPGALPLGRMGTLLGALLGGGLAPLLAEGAMEAAAAAAFVALLVTLALVDLERGLLPDMLTLPGCMMALLLSPWLAGGLREALLGGAVAFAVMLVIYLLPAGSLGAGDVKLGALLGFGLGYPRALDGLLMGVVLGGLGALAYLLWPAQEAEGGGLLRRAWRRRKGSIPYGPFLVAGGVLALLGEALWRQ